MESFWKQDADAGQWKRIRGMDVEFFKLAAFTHARLAAIHPFMDGNGRVARLITVVQVEAVCPGGSLKMDFERGEYMGALRQSRDDLGPLCRCLAKSLRMDETFDRISPPWRVAPFQEVESRDLLVELEAAKSQVSKPRL